MEPAVIIFSVAFMAPLTSIILKHRRQMFELQLRQTPQNSDEVAALRREVSELKEMVHTQILAMDRYAAGTTPRPAEDEVQARISANR